MYCIFLQRHTLTHRIPNLHFTNRPTSVCAIPVFLSVWLPVTLRYVCNEHTNPPPQITVTASNSYVTVSPSSLTFTSSDWDSTQSVTVGGVNDGTQTAEFYTATLSHAASSVDALFDGTAPTLFPSSEVRSVCTWEKERSKISMPDYVLDSW